MSSLESNFIGINEASGQFSGLVDRVVSGEEITIVRHGQPVARLVPVRQSATHAERVDAIRRMQELSQRNRLHGLSVKELIAEGRK